MPESRIPLWLYTRRVDRFGLRVRRWGSRRPLRLVLMIMDEPNSPARQILFSPAYLLGLGKLGLQLGPGEGIVEGHAGMPEGSRARAFFLPDGRAVGVSWDGPNG